MIVRLGSIFAIILGIFWQSASFADSQVPAPFGLQWGWTVAQMKAKGTLLTTSDLDPILKQYTLRNAPNQPSSTDQMAVIVDKDFRLQKILWVGKKIENDTYGSEEKRQYEEIKSLLTQKYGLLHAESSGEVIGVKLYKSADEFYQCLKYSGCGIWSAAWKGDFGYVLLSIKGLSRGSGFLKLAYEGPKWREAISQYRGKKKAKDKSAF